MLLCYVEHCWCMAIIMGAKIPCLRSSLFFFSLFFFFQAEDGIRDTSVTGVQTCALPIFAGRLPIVVVERALDRPAPREPERLELRRVDDARVFAGRCPGGGFEARVRSGRSEERRVGKECRLRGWAARCKQRRKAWIGLRD